MALSKVMELPNGFSPTYFRIRRANIDTSSGSIIPSGAVVFMQGFKDLETRAQEGNIDARVVWENSFRVVPQEGGKKPSEWNFSDLYNLLKLQVKEFEGATDC